MAGFQQLRVTREVDFSGAAKIGLAPDYPGNVYHVDKTGNDGNDGLGWGGGRALLTIQAALDKCSGRGLHTVLVASGAYQETLTTPNNATAPFGQLIGMEARDTGSGCYLYSVGTTNILTINARGWRVSGFEFESGSAAAGIKLVRESGGVNRSDYTQIDNCAFVTGKYGIEVTGAPYEVVIRNCTFFNLTTGAIYHTDSSWANARKWTIRGNDFSENASHIYLPMNQSFIYRNIFQGTGSTRSAKDANLLNITGGTLGMNQVSENHLGIADGTGAGQYDETSGSCQGGTTDFWQGNWVGFAVNNKAPASGS
ncbi:hypothetical protein LCGC14_0567290 [marine sediment metagenome]|uniref:Right handed beta helix domain-containing protein n=1 Tax=marine sediment metagenome TaxID=412755 RepID=A0A0F9S3W1_9ZZZZ